MTRTLERIRLQCLLGVVVLVLCLGPFADVALAGQAQEASIIGQVTDESGAVLPGVTVTATSPALQVPQVTDVTTERGEYRLTPLPLGTYTVQYELAGFGIVRREDVRLTAGFTARIDIALKVGALAETVTVSGAAPVVDVRSTAARTQLTRETLEIIPTGRNSIVAIMAQAPGARPQLDVTFNVGNPTFRVFGQDGDGWTTIEGVAAQSPKSGTQGGNRTDYAAIEETTVQTVGNSAEYLTRGIQIAAFVKSGGNDFHGGGYFADTRQRLQSDNLDDTLRRQGITSGNPIDARWDLSGELGGRILRDKLWFYSSARRRVENARILNAFKPDGSQVTSTQSQIFSTQKVSYQMRPSTKLIGFYQYYLEGGVGAADQFTAWESRRRVFLELHTSKLEGQWVKGNKFVSVQHGVWTWILPHGRNGCYSDKPATLDQLTLRYTGCNEFYGIDSFEDRFHTKGTLSWYKPGLLWGNHDFKAGFDSSKGHGDRRINDRAAFPDGPTNFPTAHVGNYRLILRNGVPFQIEAWNNCYREGLRKVKGFGTPCDPRTLYWYLGGYFQDSWTIARRLTLNLGVRYAHDRGWIPPQCRLTSVAPLETVYPARCFPRIDFKTWNPVVPRLHAAYDVRGDGKTVIKGGWGRFGVLRTVDFLTPANENVHLTTQFLWHDNDGDKLFDPGEINFDLNGPDFVRTRLYIAGDDALAGAVPNPNEKQPGSDEFSASVEQELIPNLAVRVTGIYSRTLNTERVQNNLRPYSVYNIPITNRDPGPDGKAGTADDPGTFVTYWDYPVALAGRAFQQPMLINDPKADQTYKSFEIAASKRMSSQWQLMASYSATRIHIPIVQNTQGAGNDFQLPGISLFTSTVDPNAEINTVKNYWEWQARATGAYIFPADIQVSANFEHRSGTPYARTVSFTGGRTIPQITLRVEPIGTRRSPNINLLHFRIEKSFRLTQGHRVAVRANIFNLTNINTVTNLTQLSGVNFEKPSVIIAPRIAEFAVQYTF